ncbi:predicted protein [Sclerotinia sclerotiorum 1980 UF-70]|uniref:Uncharacterized protein n=2 Tax=Sclerotinia sclerotiorum (strain ATCC 18683 / 1980 / Ss-1) TaxID=665079 RepID=A7ECE1_SCLS1|nr:predicted protein [Sclerotinia sclerotiorum 1980 UF-70]APA09092.1 hypothetical protein sscle_04g038620 [Sclerotinia sclerotiorum 1980 UF-70]EDO00120.1 predicted protein [Sclerotinia sclerotiorum 1980 UF-70]
MVRDEKTEKAQCTQTVDIHEGLVAADAYPTLLRTYYYPFNVFSDEGETHQGTSLSVPAQRGRNPTSNNLLPLIGLISKNTSKYRE